MDEHKLREEIDSLCKEANDITKEARLQEDAYWTVKSAVLSSKIALLNSITSARAEKMNKRLVYLTWALVFLTAALVIIEVEKFTHN